MYDKDMIARRLARINRSDADRQRNLEPANVMDKKYGAKGDGITDDTVAIKKALDNNDHVVIPSNKTFLVSSISLNKPDQKLEFQAGASFVTTGAAVDVITINGDYASVIDAYVICSGQNKSGIITKKFRNLLQNCTVTGTCVDALTVDGLETIVLFGKYKGGSVAGIHVLAPDLYLNNTYVEQNRDGLYASGVGSITAHHVHAYANTRHGFYLSGASYSELSACYADTNGANGFEIRDTAAGFDMINCWGYKSADMVANQSDFAFYNVQNMQLVACRSNGAGDQAKGASYRFDNLSMVNLVGCDAEALPQGITNLVTFTGCRGTLRRYNRPDDVVRSAGYTIAAAEAGAVSVKTLFQPNYTTPGILAFEVTALIRNNDNTGGTMQKFEIMIGAGTTVTPVINVFPETSPTLTITAPAFVDGGDGYYNLNFTATNTSAKSIQAGFHVRYLGTGRGFL